MRILFTQHTLLYRGGSELFVLDVARELKRRGHEPAVFTTALGEVADDLLAAGIPAVDDLDALSDAPDLVHAHHHLETLEALLHFQGVPAVQFCHGVLPWQAAPLTFPRIVRYGAISELIRERLKTIVSIPRDRIELFLNFADLARFLPRAPLPERPRRALVLSNQASEATYVPTVRAACDRFGIDLDVVGHANGNRTATPEAILPSYDIVFARGRAAIEALVVGAGVILCDVEGVGPIVTSDNLERLRRLNFAIGAFTEPCTVDALVERIERYDASDAALVSARMRDVAGLDSAVDRLVEIYDDVLREYRASPPPTARDELQAVIRHARWMSEYFLHQGRGPDQAAVLDLVQRIATERQAIEHEREVYARDRDAMDQERALYAADRQAYLRDQEAIERERAVYACDREAFERERDLYARDRAAMERERETYARDRAAFMQEIDAYRAERGLARRQPLQPVPPLGNDEDEA